VKGGRSGDCTADMEGRQVTLRPALYPTDVLNILTETGGFTVAGMAALSDGRVAWSLTK